MRVNAKSVKICIRFGTVVNPSGYQTFTSCPHDFEASRHEGPAGRTCPTTSGVANQFSATLRGDSDLPLPPLFPRLVLCPVRVDVGWEVAPTEDCMLPGEELAGQFEIDRLVQY